MKASIRSVALIGVLALVLASCDTGSAEPGSESTTTAANGTTTPALPDTAPEDLLDELGSLWIDGDWAGMADIAEAGAVAAAEEWGQADSVNVVWGPSCELESSGTGNCEMLIYPSDYDGYALIFSARYGQGAGGDLSILELTFAGDAG